MRRDFPRRVKFPDKYCAHTFCARPQFDHGVESRVNLKFGQVAATAILFFAVLTIAFGQSSGFSQFDQSSGSSQLTGVVKQIIVKGNKVESTAGILAIMRTKVGKLFSQDQLDADASALYSLGVFAKKPLITADHNPDGTFTVTVEVVENPIIKEIRIVGNSAIKTAEIEKVLTLKVGQIFDSKQASISSDAIAKLYQKQGLFALAQITTLPESPQTLDVEVIEQSVGAVTVTGNLRTKKRVFDHLIHTKKGQVFNINKWARDMKRLQDTGWFSQVKPTAQPGSAPNLIDLAVGITEQRTGQFQFGVQVDPTSSFAGFVHFVESNFDGTGQSIGAGFTQGTAGGGPSVDLSYSNPFIDSSNTSMSVRLYSDIIYRFTNSLFGGSTVPTTANEYNERHTGGTIGFGRQIGIDQVANISTRIEQVTTNNLNTTSGTQFIQQDGSIASINLGYTDDRRDVADNASRGDVLQLNLEPGYSNITNVGGLLAGSYVGSSYFAKIYGDYRIYYTPDKPRTINDLQAPKHVFAFRLRAGTILGNVPFFEQFFAGGADTIRGYDEDRFWGKSELLFTAEYRYPLQKSLSLIPFVDYGGAWGGYGTVNNFSQSNNFSLHLGYGIGLAFQTSFAPIRIDFGVNENGGTRTTFLISRNF